MGDVAIRIEHIGKQYRLGQWTQAGYKTLREAITWRANILKGKFTRKEAADGPVTDTSTREFWALNDVSCEIEQGEVVGIIGRNGAGKSTLLKILSRITEPTTGRVELHGRVGSLLEVGTGFHPELTGRENIYLNGAILGMRKGEIDRKFDEIVAFSEVEEFIDTPVKRYSSGMYVRLAFAVAANLEFEIMLVDEVLAVGDTQFQKKCLGKIGEVTRGGRTVLFVSHNLQAIRQLCPRAILLNSGQIEFDGLAFEAINHYLRQAEHAQDASSLAAQLAALPRDPAIRLESIILFQHENKIFREVDNGAPLVIVISYQVFAATQGLRIFFDLCDSEGLVLFRSFSDEDTDGPTRMERGSYRSRVTIPADLLSPIEYELRITATVFSVRMCLPGDGICIPLSVKRTGRANRAYMEEPIRGKLAPVLPWETESVTKEA